MAAQISPAKAAPLRPPSIDRQRGNNGENFNLEPWYIYGPNALVSIISLCISYIFLESLCVYWWEGKEKDVEIETGGMHA